MHFVGELPESEGFNAILVVTDKFTKVPHYLAAQTTCTAADVGIPYMKEICRLHGLPRHITSDRGPQFASKWAKELQHKLHINLRVSTAYHTEPDRLSEKGVQTRKQYLHIYCHDRHNHWRAWLTLAEFAYHTTSTTTHEYSRYRSLHGFDPRTIHLDHDYELTSPAVAEWLDQMTALHNQMHDTHKRINEKRSSIHIKKLRHFKIDDWELVDRRNLQIQASNNKYLTRNWLVP